MAEVTRGERDRVRMHERERRERMKRRGKDVLTSQTRSKDPKKGGSPSLPPEVHIVPVSLVEAG